MTTARISRADVILGVALAVYAIVEGVLIDAPAWWIVVAAPVALATAARRRSPAVVIALVLALIVLPGLLGTDEVDTVLPLPLIIVCGYTAGREARTARRAALAAAAVAGVLVAGLLVAPAGGGELNSAAEDIVALVVLVGGAAGAGHAVRVRRAENRELRTLASRLAAERDARARAAVLEERARVARELHDIVAHSVSLIAVQAGAAAELIGRDDERARTSVHAVQDSARGALTEMRRLLTILRSDDEDPELAPLRGLDAVGELVDGARRGGLPVELREEGRRGAVPAGLDLSAFRIVQEALTNVRKHAAGAATEVTVRYGPSEILVRVANEEAGSAAAARNGTGYGITGMRERARIYGGTLDAGARDGRYVVEARLPLAGDAE